MAARPAAPPHLVWEGKGRSATDTEEGKVHAWIQRGGNGGMLWMGHEQVVRRMGAEGMTQQESGLLGIFCWLNKFGVYSRSYAGVI